jgi:hypothetical protein
MNTNKSSFYSIKRQTIKFSLRFIRKRTLEIVPIVKKVAKKVESPKAQISLKVEFPYPDFFDSIIHTVPFLHALHVKSFGCDVTDFCVFSNIPKVKIQCDGISRITTGLQNIQYLSLSMCRLIRFYNFNESHSLKEFTLEYGDQDEQLFLKELPVRTDYNEQIRIIYAEKSNWFSPIRCSFKVKDATGFLYIVVLKLSGDFSSSQLDFDFIARIDEVDLSNTKGSESIVNFPVFKGRKLRLVGFRLSLWTEEREISTLQELSLTSCSLLFYEQMASPRSWGLPSMPSLRKLQLIKLENFRWLRTFPRCEYLILDSLDVLEAISSQPKLKQFEINNCLQVNNYSSLDDQIFSFVSIRSNRITDLRWARNSYKLTLADQDDGINLSDLLHDSFIPAERRQCSIATTRSIDLSPLSNWKRVLITSVDTFGDENDSSQLFNIHDLRITRCPNYRSTSNLHKIKNHVEISHCHDLTTLENLQHVPEVILYDLPRLTDFTGLGNNRVVGVEDVPVLIIAAERYVESKLAGKENEDPYHMIFESIKSFRILSNIAALNDRYGTDSLVLRKILW